MNQQTEGNHLYKKQIELFDPKIDFAFKQVFGQDNPECKKVLLHLLNSTFKRKNGVGIKSIEYVNPYLDKEYENDKESILDIKVKTENDELIDIEMQIGSHTHFIERCLLYWASMYEKQLVEGEDYSKLKRCVVVSIVDFELSALAEMNDYHGVFELLERTCHIKITNQCELHFIQLPKVHFKGNLKDSDNLTKWAMFLKHVNDESKKEVIDELRREVAEIDMATKILERVSQDEKNRARYESRLKWVLDFRTVTNDLQREKERAAQAENEAKLAEGKAKLAENKAKQAENKAKQAENKTKQAENMLNIAIAALHQSGMDYEKIAQKLNTTVEHVRAAICSK